MGNLGVRPKRRRDKYCDARIEAEIENYDNT
jgi:hypothetical protein